MAALPAGPLLLCPAPHPPAQAAWLCLWSVQFFFGLCRNDMIDNICLCFRGALWQQRTQHQVPGPSRLPQGPCPPLAALATSVLLSEAQGLFVATTSCSCSVSRSRVRFPGLVSPLLPGVPVHAVSKGKALSAVGAARQAASLLVLGLLLRGLWPDRGQIVATAVDLQSSFSILF